MNSRRAGLLSFVGAAAFAGLACGLPEFTPLPDDRPVTTTYSPPDAGVDAGPTECRDIGTPTPLTNAGCDDPNQPPATDRCNPPGKCSQLDVGDSKCTKDIPACPTDTACMAQVRQSGDVVSYRMGRIKLWAPASLLALEGIAVTPFVDAHCIDKSSGEGFSWLIQLDKSKSTLTTGGSRKSADHKTFSFLNGMRVDPGTLGAICPGFSKPGAAAIPLDPVSANVTWNGNTFSTEMMKALNIPIFDTDVVTNPPVILPLQEAYMKNVTVSADSNCIGSWDGNYYCGASQGWTTDGIFIGKITADDADSVPVKKVGCQSLCALLVNDSSKTDSNGHCKKGADGKVIAGIGDACVGGDGCKNAFLLSATFAAYGVSIIAPATTADAGVDAGCTPRTCAAASARCGCLDNGCGHPLDCGDCPFGFTCGGGGVWNLCGAPACHPRTCATAGANCGVVADGCGGLLDCGECGGAAVCVANRCAPADAGCTPRTCAQGRAECGRGVDDGCGATIDCGVCGAGFVCGQMAPNRCFPRPICGNTQPRPVSSPGADLFSSRARA